MLSVTFLNISLVIYLHFYNKISKYLEMLNLDDSLIFINSKRFYSEEV